MSSLYSACLTSIVWSNRILPARPNMELLWRCYWVIGCTIDGFVPPHRDAVPQPHLRPLARINPRSQPCRKGELRLRSPTVPGEMVRVLTANGIFLLLFMVVGCASFQANTELGAGRTALLRGMPLQAIPHFERAIAADHTAKYATLQESGWTYLGRANYDAKRYGEARKALQRAVEINRDDGMAHLYLGLTLARLGDHTSAKNETLAGLKLLEENLNYILFNTPSGPYWDPSGKIRREL